MSLKKSMISSALLLGAIISAPLSAMADVNAKPFTVPEVREWKGGEGKFMPSAASTRIVTDGKSEEADRIARMLGQDYTTMTGTGLPVAIGAKAGRGDIALKLKKDKKAAPESYTLDITPNGVTITAPTAQGLIWGTRTLLQLTELSADGISLPVGTIKDSPEFAMRGFMIDTGRKFFPMDYLRTLVDVLSYYKMNTLQVHLNDNGFPRFYDNDWSKTQAAFRMESDKFPGLTARDGHYTKQEFRDLIDYAASKGVEIIPEIDVPAHSLAFTQYMPEIASSGRNGFDHLDITNPKTYEFLDTLIAEYIGGDNPVFSCPRFHIGTDEYQGDSITMEQFRAFTDRYIKYTESFGKKPAIWGSLSHAKGQTPVKVDNVLMYGWSNGYANPRDMIDLGYQMVSIPDGWVYIVPKAGYYYDYLNNRMLYDNWTPATIGDITFSGADVDKIEGGMFAVWNDTPNNGLTVKDVHHRVMHSVPTMAAKTWSAGNVTVPFEEFSAKSGNMMEAPGVNYLGRYGSEPATVLTLDVVPAGATLPIPEIGYDYTVEFDIEGADEARGTKLFESPSATFWLSDPVSGKLGFSREDDLNTFRWSVVPGKKIHVKVTGNNEGTKFYVDGNLIDDLDIRWLAYYMPDNEGKMAPTSGYQLAQVRTLVFPLEKAGDFKSKITNLKVKNHID